MALNNFINGDSLKKNRSKRLKMKVSRRVHEEKWKQMAGLGEALTPRPGTPAPLSPRNCPRVALCMLRCQLKSCNYSNKRENMRPNGTCVKWALEAEFPQS